MNDNTADIELPDVTADFPHLRAPTRSILGNEYIDVSTLAWPSVSNSHSRISATNSPPIPCLRERRWMAFSAGKRFVALARAMAS